MEPAGGTGRKQKTRKYTDFLKQEKTETNSGG